MNQCHGLSCTIHSTCRCGQLSVLELWNGQCPGTPRHHKVLNCVLYEMNDGVDFGHSLAASDLLIEVEAGGHTV